jgi:hypothetical protein
VYYNRARYYDERSGRFWTADTYQGDPQSPRSLHQYLYAAANPVNRTDPTGNFDLASTVATSAIIGTLSGALLGSAARGIFVTGIGGLIGGSLVSGYSLATGSAQEKKGAVASARADVGLCLFGAGSATEFEYFLSPGRKRKRVLSSQWEQTAICSRNSCYKNDYIPTDDLNPLLYRGNNQAGWCLAD